ncbi:MAG: succinylglutamate desuccinylase/aspartoacylase family protein [Bacteroidetes bacterium]|nr:succinylglutamate desuccinylase/aspartoacylase family protein [Bacteroidota bacterium]MDA1122469.1 succinylglutamate desuccinylase/aspartoacylase family protein [Bacteroidota bacterium]
MQVQRILGTYKGKRSGPTLIFMAGIHGNETSGIEALQEVFSTLKSIKPEISGAIVGIAGNRAALSQETRYIDEDLNRLWLTEESNSEIIEFKERDEIVETLDEVLTSETEQVLFFDLHSTSTESPPFIMLSDTLRNRELAQLIGVPIILGLLEHLKGMFMEATSRSGFPTILFQGGRNGDETTVTNFKGMIWKVLQSKCLLDTKLIPECESAINLLNSFAPVDKENEFFEIIYSHKIKPETKFLMKPDYLGFGYVKKNEVLATADGIEVRSPSKGTLFMPLNQEQGEEGFYLIRPIASKWIKLSKKLKRFKFHRHLDWLVGVKKINNNPLTYKVDQQITFLWALEIFHLLGYIKVREDGPILYMARREDEAKPPTVDEAIQHFKNKSYLRSELKKIKSDWKIPFSNAQ